jgi:hypothetical protein
MQGWITMNKSFKRQWVAVAALVMTQSLVHAADADTLFSASASLVGITYHLVDLTPNDGQTPWLQINQGATGSGGQFGLLMANGREGAWQDGSSMWYAGAFPTTPVSIQSGDGITTAGATANSLDVGVGVTVSNWNRYKVQRTGSLVDLSVSSRASTGDSASYNRTGYLYGYLPGSVTGTIKVVVSDTGVSNNFTVSANTRVVVDSTFHYQYDPNLQALAALSAPAAVDAFASSTLMLSWSHPLVDLNGSVWNSWSDVDAAVRAANPTAHGDGFLQLSSGGSIDQTISAALDNTTAKALQGSWALQLDVRGSMSAGVAPIPEPGTYALMGLGLFGLAWARRRHPA